MLIFRKIFLISDFLGFSLVAGRGGYHDRGGRGGGYHDGGRGDGGRGGGGRYARHRDNRGPPMPYENFPEPSEGKHHEITTFSPGDNSLKCLK